MVMAGQSLGFGTAQKNIQKNILWMGWWWLGKAMVEALLRQIFKKYSLDGMVMAGQSHGCGTTQKNIQKKYLLDIVVMAR